MRVWLRKSDDELGVWDRDLRAWFGFNPCGPEPFGFPRYFDITGAKRSDFIDLGPL